MIFRSSSFRCPSFGVYIKIIPLSEWVLFVQWTTFSSMRMALIWQCPLRIRVPVKMKSYTSNNGPTATTCNWTIQSRRRSFSALEVFETSQRNLHLRVWTSSASRPTDGRRPCQQFAVVECSSTVRAPNPPQPRHSDADDAWRLPCHDRRQDCILRSSLVWSGFCSAADRLRLDSYLSRCKRFGFTDNTLPSVELLFSDADDIFFHRVLINSHHVLQLVLPQQHETQYNLRAR